MDANTEVKESLSSDAEVVALGNAIVLELQAAVKKGDLEGMKAMLDKHGPELLNARDKDAAVSVAHVCLVY